ncbi:MAG: hypothetical protein JO295_15470, partial [Verrucomicrobia bacterium]|nr:hypothetical protein [Verrucomicrobiota bacterium]
MAASPPPKAAHETDAERLFPAGRESPEKKIRHALLALTAPALLVVLGGLLFPAAGRDDAHIGYWVASGLSKFGRIINYNGDAIEQSSTLLHALVLAAAERLCGGSVSMLLLGRLSAIVFGVAAVVVAQRLAARIDRSLAPAAGLLTATAAYFVYWTFGGLESTLCALLALWLILAFSSYLEGQSSAALGHAGFVALLFVLARPEQPLVLVCLLAGAAGVLGLRRWFFSAGINARDEGDFARRLLVLAAVSVALIALLFVWRWHTFGSLFPQPVNAKSGSFSARTVRAGLRYFRSHLIREPGAGIFAATALAGAALALWQTLRSPRLDARLLLGVLFLAADAAFVLLAGGDWMEAARFFVPLVPVAAVLAAYALWHLWQCRPPLAIGVAGLLAIAQALTIFHVAARRSTGRPLWASVVTEPYATEARAGDFSWFERANRVNLRDIPTIRRLDAIVTQLRPAKASTGEPVRIMSAQLGMVAYHVVGRHYGHVEILDRRGLVDRRFTGCKLLARLPRTAGGLQLDYRYYFAHRAELEAECRLPRPDIIFDIGEAPEMPDYTVV